MKKVIISAALLALSGTAGAATVQLEMVSLMQQGTSVTKWSGCTTYTATTPCINPANAKLAAMGITPSTAVWSWDDATGVLSMTGTFNLASTIGSSGNAVANPVIGDRVSNLVIDTVNKTTTASSYQCAEGTFLAGVGANGCLNILLGDDGELNSSGAYNIGGNANCMHVTIGGDDSAMEGAARGLTNRDAAGGCDAQSGAFNFWHVVSYTPGGQLVIDDNFDGSLAAKDTSTMTFNATSVVPVPGAIWLLGSALGFLGVARRRLAA